MNILHHKSWHVRTRKNIERVIKDESKAAELEKEKKKKILFAEREAKIQLLRKKANTVNNNDTKLNSNCNIGNLGIFENIVDDNNGDNKTNIEHDKEIKNEKEDWEKKIGVLTYLVQSETESIDKPWYLKSHQIRMNLMDELKNDNNSNRKSDDKFNLDSKIKDFNDPLNDMKRYLDEMKRKSSNKLKSNTFNKSEVKRNDLCNANKLFYSDINVTDDKIHKKHKSKHKHKNKKRKKHKHRSKHSSDESYSSSTYDKKRKKHKLSDNESDEDEIEKDEEKEKLKLEMLSKLREQRLKREKKERERERKLLLGNLDDKSNEQIVDDRERAYNSQFNPHLAKQNI